MGRSDDPPGMFRIGLVGQETATNFIAVLRF